MELRHLRYFVAVADQLSFTRAAARLGMSQPPLSLQIQQLEREIGVSLLRRPPGKLELTDAGRAFLLHAQETLAAAERATEVARRTARGEIGELRLGLSGSTPHHTAIQKLLRTFRNRYPKVAVSVIETHSLELVRLVRDGRLDAALVLEPRDVSSELLDITVLTDRLMVVLPKYHPLAAQRQIKLAALAGEPFIIVPRTIGPGLHDLIFTACRQAGFSPLVSQESSRTASAVCFVAAGLGVSLVPGWLAGMRAASVVYRPLAGDEPLVRIALIRRRDCFGVVLDQLLGMAREISPAPR